MHLSYLRLRDFRNYQQADQAFEPGFHLLLGQNAQGKTNILEAIYLLATLRSFRGVGASQMVRHGAKGLFVGAELRGQKRCRIRYYWSSQQRRLTVDQEPVKRLEEYLGLLRAVVFCTEDLQLIKGSPKGRRRFMDLLLAQTEPTYLHSLQQYVRLLRSRNALLKQARVDAGSLEAFTSQLVLHGQRLIDARVRLIPRLAPLAQAAYRRIAPDAETLSMEYAPSAREDFASELRRVAIREKMVKSTLIGPHRDDCLFKLNNQFVCDYGSEGQKRSVAIALKMAQAELLTHQMGVPPILLIDDVMGELDRQRRSGLLPLLERAHHANGQVFMTCTEENWPRELGRRLYRWHVQSGQLSKGH